MTSSLMCPSPSGGSFCSLLRAADSSQKSPELRVGRRDFVLRSSEIATLAAIFHFSGSKPSYLGIQKNPPFLALCPATANCISTTEERSDRNHYAPPWNYNPKDGSRKKPISREEAMSELLQVISSTKPDNFTPRVVERGEDYIRVEYESPIMGVIAIIFFLPERHPIANPVYEVEVGCSSLQFVDDAEFWFPPGKASLVEYRSASRLGSFDFNINRKRIKELRLELEKKGWASESIF